jgi:ubiquitin-protein ligase
VCNANAESDVKMQDGDVVPDQIVGVEECEVCGQVGEGRVKVTGCGHGYCCVCFGNRVGQEIEKCKNDDIAQVMDIKCPSDSLCGNTIRFENVRGLVSEPFAQELLFQVYNKSLREFDLMKCRNCSLEMKENWSGFGGFDNSEMIQRLAKNCMEYFKRSEILGILKYTLVMKCLTCDSEVCLACGSAPHYSICPKLHFLQLYFLLKVLQVESETFFGIKYQNYQGINLRKGKLNPSAALHLENSQTAQKGDNQEPSDAHKKGVGYGGNENHDRNLKSAIEEKKRLVRSKDDLFSAVLDCISNILNENELIDLDIIALLNHSSLNNFVGIVLLQNSIMDLSKRSSLFLSILQVCKSLAKKPEIIHILRPNMENMDESAGNHTAIMKYLSSLKDQASLFLKDPEALCDMFEQDNEGFTMLSLCSDIKDIVSFIESKTCDFVPFGTISLPGLDSDSQEEKSFEVDEDVKRCAEILKSNSFRSVDLSSMNYKHYFESCALENKQNFNPKRMMRIRKEIATLMSNLPEGIFLLVDENRCDLMRFMIVGPEDTPYENGLFEFDLYLPPDYPSVPPKVQFLTTGKGQFRFNPNLYADGKVCLSLLGTWSGPGWDRDNSTILQVLVSIQAFIFCAEPYYNEPGWEEHRGTEEEAYAHGYHNTIREATVLYAMLWHFESPYGGFKDVIQAYFAFQKTKIIKQLQKWSEILKAAVSAKESHEDCYSQLLVEKEWSDMVALMEQNLAKTIS